VKERERKGCGVGRLAAGPLPRAGPVRLASFFFCFFSIFYFPDLFFGLFETFLFSFGSTFIL
jgi:hypothetical protein